MEFKTYTKNQVRNIKRLSEKEPNIYEEIAQFLALGMVFLVILGACIKCFG
jgi:hypothetical protein